MLPTYYLGKHLSSFQNNEQEHANIRNTFCVVPVVIKIGQSFSSICVSFLILYSSFLTSWKQKKS